MWPGSVVGITAVQSRPWAAPGLGMLPSPIPHPGLAANPSPYPSKNGSVVRRQDPEGQGPGHQRGSEARLEMTP